MPTQTAKEKRKGKEKMEEEGYYLSRYKYQLLIFGRQPITSTSCNQPEIRVYDEQFFTTPTSSTTVNNCMINNCFFEFVNYNCYY